MLFLLNDQIVELPIPEVHLSKCWKALGCGDPYGMRAREAIDFAARVVSQNINDGVTLDTELVKDLASLIIAKTGANAVMFPTVGEPRLTILPDAILGSLRDRAEQEEAGIDVSSVWPLAA
jgi:hypothetical protein